MLETPEPNLSRSMQWLGSATACGSWSLYRGYAGYTAVLTLLCLDPLRSVCGGRTEKDRRQALRDYTEQPLRQGMLERPSDRVQLGLVLGTVEFARQMLRSCQGNPREQRALGRLDPVVPWDRIIVALERVKGEKWKEFRDRYGDWGWDAALWLSRRQGRLKLAESPKLRRLMVQIKNTMAK